MRLVTYEAKGNARVGVLDGDEIVDLKAIAPDLPDTLKAVIAAGLPAGLADRVRGAPAKARIKRSNAKLLLPISDPGKIVCVGLNYHDHAAETGQAVPTFPPLFLRATTSLAGPEEPMVVPKVSEELDFEAELTIVIGRTCRHVSQAEALDYVFGYTCFNEGSVRYYQRKSTQWTGAKNFDRTGPLGPWITTADEVPVGADGLRVRTVLNGEVMQNASTASMIFKCAEIVSTISSIMTLEPGDLIPTGTPAGVGMGRKPPIWLKPGDVVTVSVEDIGELTSGVVAEA